MKFSIKVSLWALAVCLLTLVPQMQAQNYVSTQSTGASIVPGTTDTGNNCDDCMSGVALPFTYRLYDQDFTSVQVGSNGTLQFNTGNTDYSNTALPNNGFDHTIFPYWDDLYTGDSASGQGIFTSVSGGAPNRVFNIEWRTVLCCNSGVPDINFQVRLFEGQQKFEVIYGSLTGSGESATVGVQHDLTEYTQFSFDTPGVLSSGMKLTYNLAPTAANASISGRVLTLDNNGLRNAVVVVTGIDGISRQTRTSSFGKFSFDQLPAGETYVIEVFSKKFAFEPQIINLTESVTDLSFLPAR